MSKYEQKGTITFSPTALTDKEEIHRIYAIKRHKCETASLGNKTVTVIPDYMFASSKNVTSISYPNVTEIGEYAFAGCASLIDVNLPAVTNIGVFAFNNCDALTKIALPMCQNIGDGAFESCSSLIIADFLCATRIPALTFDRAESLRVLILRNSTVVSLGNNKALDSTLIGSGEGYIYVPSDLVETYKTTRFWNTYASQFRALEDYTVDGTIVGDFDERKIR